jgi:hypothetical protein
MEVDLRNERATISETAGSPISPHRRRKVNMAGLPLPGIADLSTHFTSAGR